MFDSEILLYTVYFLILKKVSFLHVIFRQDAPFIYIYFTTLWVMSLKKQRGGLFVWSTGAAGSSALCCFSVSCVCFSSAIHSNAFIKHWVVASSPVCQFLNEERRRIPKLRVIYWPTVTVHTSWSLVCGMSGLHLLICVQSLWSVFLHPHPQIFLCIPVSPACVRPVWEDL